MKKISTIFALLIGIILSALNFACQNSQYEPSNVSQTMWGYMRIEKDSPDYRFYFSDINDHFVGYLDTSAVVSTSFDKLVDKPVVVRGKFVETPNGKVIYADNIKLKRSK